jgi:hypothetical protein
MPRRISTVEREQAYREAFLARLGQKLSAPSDEWPTVRWWTERSLNRMCAGVRKELAEAGEKANLTDRSLLEWLERLGLAHCLSMPEECFYLVEIGAGTHCQPDPYELLMAAKPGGVVCYFSAISFHALTTQTVGHHHIAELKVPSSDVRRRTAEDEGAAPGGARADQGSRKSCSLGRVLFRFQVIPFYFTRRSARLVPGVQVRDYGPRSRVRITTLEQTLLDSLYKPFHCGGPEVVFEAWEEGIASHRVDEERMADHLERMEYPATARRLGVMLELLGHVPGGKLHRVLERCRLTIDRESPFATISLLPGLNYENLNDNWLVRMP